MRVKSLTLGGGSKDSLSGAEKHGLRQDQTGQARRIREADPVVHGSLNLRQAYDEHTAGTRTNRGLKRPVLHGVFQFPTELTVTRHNQEAWMKLAIEFVNQTHGGDAVFAARVDRDEEGQHSVDVFYCPKYEKTTKKHGTQTWISPTKHGKELAEKHRAEIETRHDGKFSTGPRQVGIALNAEWHEFLTKKGLKLEPRQWKDHGYADRLSPEAYKAAKDRQRREVAEKQVDAMGTALGRLRGHLEGFKLPQAVGALLDGLHRKYVAKNSVTRHRREDRADLDLKGRQVVPVKPRSPEPPPPAPAPPAPKP